MSSSVSSQGKIISPVILCHSKTLRRLMITTDCSTLYGSDTAN
jgi:hypothetical protein